MSEGGLTLDLSGLREVTVDAANKLVSVGGGCRLGDVDAAVASHGLTVPAGIMSETGVAGLSLGGGIGWFSRKHGLTCDQFVSPPTSTPTCSGPSRAAAGTSALSRASPSAPTNSAR